MWIRYGTFIDHYVIIHSVAFSTGCNANRQPIDKEKGALSF